VNRIQLLAKTPKLLPQDAFIKAGATPSSELSHLKHDQRVKIGNLIVARQHPPTAKGFAFLAVEDSIGLVNAVLVPDVYARYRSALQGAFVLIEGVVQKDHGATPHCTTPCGSVGASVNVVAYQIRIA
jgi:error-prone DNA polymerase